MSAPGVGTGSGLCWGQLSAEPSQVVSDNLSGGGGVAAAGGAPGAMDTLSPKS